MSVLEILLIVIGAVIFVLSFVIPAKKEEELEETKELAKAEIKELVNQELSHVKENVEGAVDETISYAVEKTERFMDRLSNEKIMAINEYSDTVMEDIHKNHTEVMFLYDMLNEKSETLKSTSANVDKAVKEAKVTSEKLAAVTEEVAAVTEEATSAREDAFFAREDASFAGEDVTSARENGAPISGTKKKPQKKEQKKVSVMPIETSDEVQVRFDDASMENKNEEILRLHQLGKSNVAIAKELDLGVGEVKLVIGLFEGNKK